MKVYIITGEPFPNGLAATNRIKCYAKAVISQGAGCEVIVFRKTENPSNPTNTVGIGMFDSVIPFRYIHGSPVPNKNFFIRKMEGLTAERRTVRYLKKRLKPNDIVFAYIGRDLGFVEKLITLTHDKKGVFCRDLCELPYGTGEETAQTIRCRQYMLERVFPKIDGFVAISDALFDLAKTYASADSSVIKIPIMVEFAKYSIEDRSDRVKVPFIFHAGTLTEKKDGFISMLEAFAIAENRLPFPIRFVVAGDLESSPDKEKICSMIDRYNLKEKIVFLGYLKSDEVLKPLSEASLVVLNKYPNQQNQYGFSTKLGEYMAAGKPVVITRVGEAMNWLSDKENAYIVDYGNTGQLADTIIKAFENPEERRRIGDNARLLCQKAFDYNVYGKALTEMFEQQIKQKSIQ